MKTPSCRIDRRRMLLGAGLLGLFGSVALHHSARAQAGAIRVDTSPLAGKGLGRYSDKVAAFMRAALDQAYGGALRSGNRLTVRIDHVQMAAFGGAIAEDDGGSTPMNDYMRGEGIVSGPRGEVIRTFPILASLDASSGGAWYAEGNEDRRLAALAQHFAQWMRRYTGP